MYCIFFYSNGPVCQICVPKYQTITGSFYTNECLTEVEKFYQNRRPRTGTRGLRILHDNARPHKTKLAREKLEAMKIVELDYSPYSPDLAPCDFWLFPMLMKYLSGRKFENRAQMGSRYKVAEIIAKKPKPFSDGEFIKECLRSVAEIIYPDKTDQISKISLSHQTIARRIVDLSCSIENTLILRASNFRFYSLALDESTDATDTAQVAIFIRGIDDDFNITEEMAALVH
ncbi:General transcription factor II-I repeat domain-containing protein 2-like [Oopsacas minuta]|uniref:General transcription factor II-I repeat domain-containing protein 2-like n=1 Tax=Oopsacas minuta TaxID=111878 RepID=A0AAV7K6F2_9METZ|nr:General transcription factor II-I repeat domain-containing protein 2-like [Oopsacas minuta]